MMMDRMRLGVWLYGLSTIATGALNILWRDFEPSHQPFQALGKNIPGEHILGFLSGIWLVAAGIALLWRRSSRMGAAGSAIMYVIFALLWIPRIHAITHAFGFRIGAIVFGIGGVLAQLLLASTALIVYTATTSDPESRAKATTGARWMLGLAPIFFGMGHLISLHAYVAFVPHWVPFALFWVVLTGTAFLLAGCAIVTGIQDILAARMLALMLLLFEFSVEIPPVFGQPHSQAAWGGALYNLTAIGACWIFAELAESRRRADRRSISAVENYATTAAANATI